MSDNSIDRFGYYHGSINTIAGDDGKFKGDEFFFMNLLPNLMELDDGTDLGFLDVDEEWDDVEDNRTPYSYSVEDFEARHLDIDEDEEWICGADAHTVSDEFDVEEDAIVSHLGSNNTRREALKERYASERYSAEEATAEELEERREKLLLRRQRNNGYRKCNKRETIRRAETVPLSRRSVFDAIDLVDV
ncbi:hypothetical protein KC851_00940 [Candidatus Kaiserbacteria bacterium]|nr:hypothetical protein [Candidatus Kaiserbacteria bacterium]